MNLKIFFILFSITFKLLPDIDQSDVQDMQLGIKKIKEYKKPKVTFFGGSRFKDDDFYFKSAFNLSYKLAKEDFVILTGGGPGIMQAGNCGSYKNFLESGKLSNISIGLKNLYENLYGSKAVNFCSLDSILVEEFFVRQRLLIYFSSAFIFFPGGYGTLDELGEVLTLIATKRIERVSVILFGKEFWLPFLNWMKNKVFKLGLVDKENQNIIILSDNIDEIVKILKKQNTKLK